MVSLETTGVPTSIEGLVRLAREGDEAAFAWIVRQHHAEMTRICFVVTGDAVIADEAVAAAWPIVWRRLDGLREPERLRQWLVAIAVNEARQLVRRSRRRSVVEIDLGAGEWAGSGAADPAARAADLDLLAAVRRLDASDRALLALRYVAGFDSTELSRATGLTPSGVRARLGRLLDRLRTELGDD
jgi:RNA polymerase sigma factor (sigma-70 family)